MCECSFFKEGKTVRSWLVKVRQGDRAEGERWSLKMVAAQILGTGKGIKVGPRSGRHKSKWRG